MSDWSQVIRTRTGLTFTLCLFDSDSRVWETCLKLRHNTRHDVTHRVRAPTSLLQKKRRPVQNLTLLHSCKIFITNLLTIKVIITNKIMWDETRKAVSPKEVPGVPPVTHLRCITATSFCGVSTSLYNHHLGFTCRFKYADCPPCFSPCEH